MYSEEYCRKLWGAMDFACDCFEDCNECPCCETKCDFGEMLLNKPSEGTINTCKLHLKNMTMMLAETYDANVSSLIGKIIELNKLDDEHTPIVIRPNQLLHTRTSSSTTSTSSSSNKSVVSPKYYAEGENQWECGNAMIKAYGEQAFLDFCLCNSLKYLWRAREKGGNDDIRKAINYLNKYLEVEEANSTPA